MSLLRFFVRLSGAMAVLIAGVSVLAGLCNTALLAILNRALSGADSLALLAGGFTAVALAKLGASLAGDVLLIRFAARMLAQLRDAVALDILRAPLRRVETLGSGRLIALLTEDIETLNEAYLSLPYLGSQAAMLFGGAVYLAWLSPPTLVALAAFSALALLVQRAALRRSRLRLERARRQDDLLLAHFHGLTDGLKQLKLHRGRREGFLRDDIARTSREGLEHHVASDIGFSMAEHFTQLALYGLLALLLFAVPHFASLGRETLTGYVLTIVFLLGPSRALLNGYGRMVAAQVAAERLEELGGQVRDLAQLADVPQAARENECAGGGKGSFEELELRSVSLSYDAQGAFRLGPVSVRLRRGEVVFVTGGNGSGKTSLVKILCGLYEPDGGEVILNGAPVPRDRRDEYRQLFSAVFADHHLFDRPAESLDRPGVLEAALERFELAHRIRPVDGRFPDLELSRGQRARLALVFALLEDRPIYVFDEWAAEQDPVYRRRFYEEFVPELKARGKTVVVITHDDRFFGRADRVWHFREGRCEEQSPQLVPESIAEFGGSRSGVGHLQTPLEDHFSGKEIAHNP
jgi:putative ATP-binding cassette transporter